MYGFTDINKEMENVDNEMTEKISSVSNNPWLSEGARSRQISLIQEKFT